MEKKITIAIFVLSSLFIGCVIGFIETLSKVLTSLP